VVPYHLLDFSTGPLRIEGVDPNSGYPDGTYYFPDPIRHIVHRGHLLSLPDNWGGPMRSLVFWWLLGTMSREWWARFLDRYGAPFLIGKYDQEDDASRSVLERAFSFAVKVGGLVVSKETDVDIKQAATGSTGDAYERFLTICQREKSKLIVGQTLSSEAQSTGLGSGVANMQSAVSDDIMALDAMLLGETLRDQLFTQLLAINRIPGQAPKISWGAFSPEKHKALADLLVALNNSGIQIRDESLTVLSERLGLELERKVGAATPTLPLTAFAVDQQVALLADQSGDRLAAAAAPALAQGFRGSMAPVRRIIMESRSSDECEQRIREYYADWNPSKISGLMEEALEAYAANGVAASVR